MSDTDLLSDYLDLEPFAAEVKRHPRTVRRWMNEPDGLPYTHIGNRILIHIPTAKRWIFGRMRRPNPTRRHLRGRQPVQHAAAAVKRGRAAAKTRTSGKPSEAAA